jgi:hypothetical protein
MMAEGMVYRMMAEGMVYRELVEGKDSMVKELLKKDARRNCGGRVVEEGIIYKREEEGIVYRRVKEDLFSGD